MGNRKRSNQDVIFLTYSFEVIVDIRNKTLAKVVVWTENLVSTPKSQIMFDGSIRITRQYSARQHQAPTCQAPA